MSLENVEIVRRCFQAFEEDGFDAAADAFDPQVEFTRTGGGSDVLGYTTESRGIDGLRAALGAWTGEWTDVRVQPERFVEAGEQVLVLARHRGIGRRSGVPLDHLDAWVFSFHEGRISRWDAYWDPAEPMRSLGIEQ